MNLQPGDIFAVKGSGIAGWAVRHLISPTSDRFHFGLIWRKQGDDYIILESIFPKGIAVGLLSHYDNSELKFYRVNCADELRRRAPMALVRHGRVLYDWLLPFRLGLGYITALLRLRLKFDFRPIRSEDLPYVRDSLFACTEAVLVAYLSVDFRIIPKGVAPTPNSFRGAEIRKVVTEITE